MSLKKIRERDKNFLSKINDLSYSYNDEDLLQLHQDRAELLKLVEEAKEYIEFLKKHCEINCNKEVDNFLSKLD